MEFHHILFYGLQYVSDTPAGSLITSDSITNSKWVTLPISSAAKSYQIWFHNQQEVGDATFFMPVS